MKSGCLTPASILKCRVKSHSLVHSHCSLVTTSSSIPSTKHNMVRQSSPPDSLGATLSSSKRTKVYLWFSLRWIRQEMCVCFRLCLHLVTCLKLDKRQIKLDVQNLSGMEKHMKSSKSYFVVEDIPRETVKSAMEARSWFTEAVNLHYSMASNRRVQCQLWWCDY